MAKFDNVIGEALKECAGIPSQRYSLTVEYRGHQMKSIAVISYRHIEDYLSNFFSAITVDAAFSVKDYSGVIMAGHEDLTATLSSTPADGGPVISKKYRAFLLSDADQRMEGNSSLTNSMSKANEQSIAIGSFQLLDTVAYDLIMRECGGTFSNCTAVDVLKYMLSQNMLKDLYSNQEAVRSINAEPEAYEHKYGVINIKPDTKLTKLGDHLQSKYGIYSTGFGLFLKNLSWYIFSPYNVNKFKRSVEKLVVINAPGDQYKKISKNFFVKGSTITIVGTGETNMLKTTDANAINTGTGVRYADVTKLMDFGAIDPNEDKPKMHPKDYMTEFRGVNYNNKFNNTRMVPGSFSSNPCVQSSLMAASAGNIVNTIWESGTTDIFTPGMPVEFIYSHDGDVLKARGVLLKVELNSQDPRGGLVSQSHENTVVLSIFLQGSV